MRMMLEFKCIACPMMLCCLSRKKNTLECFLEDLKWAKESHDTSKCQVRVSRKRKKQKGCKEQCSRQKRKRRKFIKIQEVQGSGDVDCPHLQPKDHSCMEIQAGPGDVDYPQLQPDDHSCSECQEGLSDINNLQHQPNDHSCPELQAGPGDVDYPQLQPTDHSCLELQVGPGDVNYPQLQPTDHRCQLQSDNHNCSEPELQAGPGGVDYPQLRPDDHSCSKPELQADPGKVDYPQLQPDDHSCLERQASLGDIDYPKLHPTDHRCLELQAGPGGIDYPQLQPDDHSCLERHAGPGGVDYSEDCEDLDDLNYIVKTEDEETEDESDSESSILDDESSSSLMSEDEETEDESDSESSILDDEGSRNLMNDVVVESCLGDVYYLQLQPYDHSCPEPELRAGPSDVDYHQLQPDDHSCLESQAGLGDVEYPQLQPDDHSCSERQVGQGDIDYPEDCEDLDDPDFIVETEDEETKDESDSESSILDDESSSNLMNDVVVESYPGDVGYPKHQPVDHSCTELQAGPSDVDYPQLQPDDHNCSELQAGPGDVDYPQLQPDDHSCAELQAGPGDINNPQLQPTDHSCLKLQAGPGDVDFPQHQPDDHSCAELQAGPGDIDNPQLQPTDHSFLELQAGPVDVDYPQLQSNNHSCSEPELQAGPGDVDNPQLQPDDHSCPQGLASSDDVDYPEDCEDLNDPDYIVETEDESDSESSILDDESSSNLMNDVEVESCMGDVDYPQLQPDDHSCPELQAGPDDVDSPQPEDCEALDERDLDCDNPPCKRKLDEKDCLFDKKFPNVFIKGLKKDNAKSKHNRVYDCVHACLYCHELFTNIQSHLERRHVNHTRVKAIKELKDQKMKETNQEKIEELEKRLNSEMKLLRNLGDHHHNMKVLRHKEGELLLPRRRLVTFNLEEYGPCPKCKEWMVLNSSISIHQKTCPVKSTDYHKGSTIIQIGILTGKVKTTGSKRIVKEVLPSMKRDKFAEICMNDPLILALGDVWFMKNIDNKRKRKYYSSFHMRLAARLLLAFRNLVKRMDVSMSEMLSPENFDNVAEVALQICNSTEHEEDELQHPSTAIKSGFDLMRMASSKVGISIKTKNKEMKKEGEAFMYLMSKEWGYKVNKVARSTLSERMFNQKKELPYPEDIMKLSSYLVENLESVDLSYTAVSGMMFRRIVMLVEARLLLYNRRRPGELEALSLQCYRNRSKEVSATDLSLREQLSKFEKEMLDNQELVEIRGKNGTRVPVICPKEVIPAMNYLASKEIRKKAGIRDGNPFLFANTAEDVVRAGYSLEEIRTECRSLKFPDRIYATNLRKYCATIAQVIGLKDHELKYLCRHMGHTMEVHELHYRSTSGLIERLEIAKLMVMQECNVVGKFHGKSLKDITFEDILDKEDISPTQGEAARGEETPSVEDTSLALDDMEEDVLVSRRKPKKSVRKPWTKEEEEEMKKYFKTYYDGTTKKTCPSRAECQRAIELSKNNGGYIHLRSWETIKKKVNNFLFSSVKKK